MCIIIDILDLWLQITVAKGIKINRNQKKTY